MRRIASHFVFCGKSDPIKFGIITLNGSSVIEVSQPSSNLTETEAVEFYPGVVVPGLVGVGDNSAEWIPTSDSDISSTLCGKTRPTFAGLTLQNIEQLSAEALEQIMQQSIKPVLLGETETQQQLFRTLQKLSEKMPSLTMQQLLSIACINGAAAAKQSEKGTIAAAMKPGICHISAFDFTQMNIQPISRINVLIS